MIRNLVRACAVNACLFVAIKSAHGGPCIHPLSYYGGVPGSDNTAAIQRAVDSELCVDVTTEPGIYFIVNPTSRPTSQLAIINLPWAPNGAGARFFGAGGGRTRFVFTGETGNFDWRGFQIANGATASFDGVQIECTTGDGCTTHDEHSALIFGRGTKNVSVTNSVFVYPPVVGSPGGDCINLIGYAPNETTDNAVINGNEFRGCKRSCLSYHSGMRGLTFTNNTATQISDQCLDGEGADGGNPLIIGLIFSFNTVINPPGNPLTVQIEDGENIDFYGNVLTGGVDLLGARHGRFGHNSIVVSTPDAPPAIWIRKNSFDLKFSRESYTRTAAAGAKPVFAANYQITSPHDIELDTCTIVQGGGTTAVDTSGIVGFRVIRSLVSYEGTGVAYGFSAIAAGGVRTDNLEIVDTTFTGATRAAVRISGSAAGAGRLTLRYVTTTGTPTGLRCEATDTQGTITGPVDYVGNAMPKLSCGAVSIDYHFPIALPPVELLN